MRLNEPESRIAVAALQTLEREVADCIEQYAEPTRAPLPPALRSALDQHETLSTLTKKLATAGDHDVIPREVDLTLAGLDRYLELLSEPLHESGDSNDFLLSPDLKAREHEFRGGTLLFEKLTRSR